MKILLSIFLSFLPVVLWGQVITTICGNGTAGYSGDGGPASAAQVDHPFAIKFDKFGNKYFSDHYNHVVRKINTSGIISTIAGNGYGHGTLNGGYTGDGGQATNAELDKPSDITFDDAGNLYIADFGNSVIRKVNTAGIITTFAGTGVGGYSGDGGPALSAKIYDPLGLIFDAAGNLYFSNNGTRVIRKINTAGIISTIAGTGVGGTSGDGGPATDAQIRLTGMLAFSPSGDLYVPDYKNYRIRKINASGIISTVVGTGINGNTGDGGPAAAANIGEMWAILFDPVGNMYLSNRVDPEIRKVDAAGIITTIAGTRVMGYSGDGGPAIDAQLNVDFYCSSMDEWGNLYIADQYNHRIRRITYDYSAVKDIPNNISTTIYPNPATHEITITAPTEIKDIAVVDVMGREKTSPRPSPKEREGNFSVAHLPPGMYFVKVNGVYAGRFVKE